MAVTNPLIISTGPFCRRALAKQATAQSPTSPEIPPIAIRLARDNESTASLEESLAWVLVFIFAFMTFLLGIGILVIALYCFLNSDYCAEESLNNSDRAG